MVTVVGGVATFGRTDEDDVGQAGTQVERCGVECVERRRAGGRDRDRRSVQSVCKADLGRGHVRPDLDLGLAIGCVDAVALQLMLRSSDGEVAAHRCAVHHAGGKRVERVGVESGIVECFGTGGDGEPGETIGAGDNPRVHRRGWIETVVDRRVQAFFHARSPRRDPDADLAGQQPVVEIIHGGAERGDCSHTGDCDVHQSSKEVPGVCGDLSSRFNTLPLAFNGKVSTHT